MKIGHGPATVNAGARMIVMGASGCESGNLPGLVEAGTLREKECGDGLAILARLFCLVPRSLRLARLAERAWAAQVVTAGRRSAGPSALACLRASTNTCATGARCLFRCDEIYGGRLRRGWRKLLGAALFCAVLGRVAHAGLPVASAAVWSQSNAANTAPARVVTDETGRRVAIPAEVKRVVTLAPNLTETIYALGLDERLAGDTDYCDTPPAAKLKPHVGGAQNPSLEAIVALHPDLVLATTSINRIETVDGLAKVGIAVYTTDPQTVRGMLESTARIAGLMGAEAQGAALVAKLQRWGQRDGP